MREYCLTHLYKTKPNSSELHFVIVEDENKVIYCTIPKVSSTTWKRVLGDLRGLEKNIKKIHRVDLWPRLSQYTDKQRSERIQTYFKFLFVREPLHRLLSAYKDKFLRRNRECSKRARKQIIKAYRPHDYKPNRNSIMTTPSPSLSLFSIFPMMCRGINSGDNTNSSVIRVLLTTISLVI